MAHAVDEGEVTADPQVAAGWVSGLGEDAEDAVGSWSPGDDVAGRQRHGEDLVPGQGRVAHVRASGAGVAHAVVVEVATSVHGAVGDSYGLDVTVGLIDRSLQGAVEVPDDQVATGAGAGGVDPVVVGDQVEHRERDAGPERGDQRARGRVDGSHILRRGGTVQGGEGSSDVDA